MYKLQRLTPSITGCVILLSVMLVGCSSDDTTPGEFKNKTTVSDSAYAQDSLYFSNQIMSFIKEEKSAFYPKSYDHLTSKVYIDTILYSPSKLKAAFFAIIKNSNSKLLVSDNPDGFHFNAKCFLARRDSLSNNWDLKWFRIMNINRYSDYEEISKQIRKRYFVDLEKIDSEDGTSRYKYNLNDVRFWDGPAWSNDLQSLERNYSGDGG